MSAYVKLMTHLEKETYGDEAGTLDVGVIATPPAAGMTYWRQCAVEAAEALHKMRPDLPPGTAVRRVLFRFDAEGFEVTLLDQARDTFVERWKHLQASAPATPP